MPLDLGPANLVLVLLSSRLGNQVARSAGVPTEKDLLTPCHLCLYIQSKYIDILIKVYIYLGQLKLSSSTNMPLNHYFYQRCTADQQMTISVVLQ